MFLVVEWKENRGATYNLFQNKEDAVRVFEEISFKEDLDDASSEDIADEHPRTIRYADNMIDIQMWGLNLDTDNLVYYHFVQVIEMPVL